MGVWKDFGASVRERGVGQSAWMGLNKLADRWFDLVHGTETMRRIESGDLPTDSQNKALAGKYVPSNGWAFSRLLRALALPTDATFVDLGSGKGRVLIMALEYGFRRVVGVDFSSELCRVARRNLEVARRRSRSDSVVEIVEGDVTEFHFGDGDWVIYLFDPFAAEIVSRVADNLLASLARAPGEVHLIYCCPAHRHVIEARPEFRLVGEHRFGGYDFAIWATGSRAAPRPV